jgi:hypothetical protein
MAKTGTLSIFRYPESVSRGLGIRRILPEAKRIHNASFSDFAE